MVLKRKLKMNGSIKLLSRIFKVLKTLKFIKRDQEKMLFSFFQIKFSNFQKNVKNESILLGVCVQNFKHEK